MRRATKIVLAAGLILGVFWISPVLGAVFLLVFLVRSILARGGLQLAESESMDELDQYSDSVEHKDILIEEIPLPPTVGGVIRNDLM